MNPLERLRQLSAKQLMAALAAAALVLALVVATWLWGRTPDYKPLYANLPERDAGGVVAALAQLNVPYKVSEAGNTILVPASQVPETRLKLASQGLPKGGGVGFELMEQQKLGATQFQEQVTYQRALEGELARSIQSLSAVQAARVHLALPKPSVFVREQNKPSASVLLTLHPGRSLERAQVAGIVHLVASSVPELAARAVSVIDQSGALLNQSDDAAGGADPAKLGYVRQLEQSYIKRVLDLLEPIVGAANVRAQVTAEVDFTQSEQTAETYKPNSGEAAIRSQQSSESTSGDGGVASGIPGAPSNQPAAATTATTQTSAPRRTGKRDSTTNYEVDKTVRLTREAPGRVRRVNAAVVINHRRVVDAAGKATSMPLAKEELEQITALVREAIGFNAQRGDSLSISNTAFTVPDAPPPAAAVPAWKDPENRALAREIGTGVVAALLILYLFFGVVRPLMRTVRSPRHADVDGVAVDIGDDAVRAALGQSAAPALPGGANAAALAADPLVRAQSLARDNPRAAALVLKKWLNGNE